MISLQPRRKKGRKDMDGWRMDGWMGGRKEEEKQIIYE
jgi:hypothetical protein